MERYLEGEEISHEHPCWSARSSRGVTAGRIFPVTCGVATRNLGTNRLLDAIVEDLPSPAKKGPVTVGDRRLEPVEDADSIAFVFKTLADPFAGRINLFRVYQGLIRADSQIVNCRTHAKERIGHLLVPQGKDMGAADEFGPGDIGAVSKLKDTRTGDVLSSKDQEVALALPPLPSPVMALRSSPRRGATRRRWARRCAGCRTRTPPSMSTAIRARASSSWPACPRCTSR